MVITDDCTRYRWLYGMKTKDEILKRWFSDIAVLTNTHKLLVLVHDNAGENKSQELNKFFESNGVRIVSALRMSSGRMDSPNHHLILS